MPKIVPPINPAVIDLTQIVDCFNEISFILPVIEYSYMNSNNNSNNF